MKCFGFIYSVHSLQAIISRSITLEEVEDVISQGEVIANYETDKPYPSKLILKIVNNRPLHVVIAQNADTLECIVVTSYVPDPLLWDATFKQKIR